MAAFVVSALEALGLSRCVSVVLNEGRPRSQGRSVLLAGAIRGLAGIHGRALLIGPLAWFAQGGRRDSVTTRAEDTPVEGGLELGRTVVPEAELGAAAPGDAIVFDGTPSLPPGMAWPVHLLVGKSYASARLAPDNSLSLVGTWAQIDTDQADPLDNGTRWKAAEPESPPTTGFTDASVEVVAEVGRISLLGDELAGLSKGESLSLGPRPSDLIHLRVRGRLWATGTLVALGEQLGVRIVRLHG